VRLVRGVEDLRRRVHVLPHFFTSRTLLLDHTYDDAQQETRKKIWQQRWSGRRLVGLFIPAC
jgi:hypothetical protein